MEVNVSSEEMALAEAVSAELSDVSISMLNEPSVRRSSQPHS